MHFTSNARLPVFGCLIVLASLTAGCAGSMGSNRTNYDKLPGSGDHMADGPGIITPKDPGNYDGGYTVYSNEQSKKALVNPNQARQSPATSGQTRPQQTETTPAASAQPTAAQQQNYREFQQYRQFKQMPKNSAEYQRFRDWQEFKRYQQWQNNGQTNP